MKSLNDSRHNWGANKITLCSRVSTGRLAERIFGAHKIEDLVVQSMSGTVRKSPHTLAPTVTHQENS